jgi:acetyl esterase/lipase
MTIRTTEPDLVLRYADGPDGVIDVHLPQTGDVPSHLIVLLHGGFWRARIDRRHTRPAAAFLRDTGYVVATPEFRRAGARGGWPATFDDVRTSVESAPALIADAAATAGITVLGHSAGGHLALWLAANTRSVDRIIALAPVGDLQHAHANNVGDGAVHEFLGGPQPEADPAVLLPQAEPASEIIILHGDADAAVPLANSTGWAGDDSRIDLRILPGVGHMDLINPSSTAWVHVMAALLGRPRLAR